MLVTGANGFIGRHAVSTLVRNNLSVVEAVRSQSTPCLTENKIVVGELSAEQDWSAALRDCDVVIHLAACVNCEQSSPSQAMMRYQQENVDATTNLAEQAIKAGVQRFIFLSTVKVNGEFSENEQPFTETMLTNPQDDYAKSKCLAEQALLKVAENVSMDVVIIRPPLVYGAEVKGNFSALINLVKKEWPLPFGGINNKRSLLSVNNLIEFIVMCLDKKNSVSAANQVFLLADASPVSTCQLAKIIAKIENKKIRLFSVPQFLIKLFCFLIGKASFSDRLLKNLEVSSLKATRLIGWKPKFSIEEQLDKS